MRWVKCDWKFNGLEIRVLKSVSKKGADHNSRRRLHYGRIKHQNIEIWVSKIVDNKHFQSYRRIEHLLITQWPLWIYWMWFQYTVYVLNKPKLIADVTNRSWTHSLAERWGLYRDEYCRNRIIKQQIFIFYL